MPKKKKPMEVTIKNAKIGFRNFQGAEGKYNPAGNRNFCIFLPDDIAKEMEKDGWNIKWLDAYPDEPPQAIVSVRVNFGNYPPNIVVISDGKMTRLNEDNVNLLDFAEFEQIDLIIRGSEWNVRGNSGIKAYLKSGYFVLYVDELAKKYSKYIDSAQEAIGGCGECDICDSHCGGGLQ